MSTAPDPAFDFRINKMYTIVISVRFNFGHHHDGVLLFIFFYRTVIVIFASRLIDSVIFSLITHLHLVFDRLMLDNSGSTLSL